MTAPPSNKTIPTYMDRNQYHNDAYWTIIWVDASDNDSMMEIGEKAQITSDCTNIDGSSTTLNPTLGAYERFTIEFKPPLGAVVTVERITPVDIDPVMNLF